MYPVPNPATRNKVGLISNAATASLKLSMVVHSSCLALKQPCPLEKTMLLHIQTDQAIHSWNKDGEMIQPVLTVIILEIRSLLVTSRAKHRGTMAHDHLNTLFVTLML